MTLLDWAIIALYFVFATGIGVAMSRRAGSSITEFFIGGRSLPWWLAGTSMVASLVVTYFLTSIEGTWRFLLAIGAGTGLVLILRWYWWRINAWSEISAMIASLVVSVVLWFGVGLDPDDPVQWAWIMLATVGASTVVWLVVTFATRPEEDEVLRAFYLRVRPGGRGWRGLRWSPPRSPWALRSP